MNNVAKVSINGLKFEIDADSPNDYRDTFLESINVQNHFIPDEIRLDLLYISNFIYATDRRVLRANAIDSWTRYIEIEIPVIDLTIWNGAKDILTELLNFLTGDRWTIQFTKRLINEKEKILLESREKNELINPYSQVCMFSGGLDSFIGAIDIISSEPEDNTLFVSHYGGGSKGTKYYQDSLIKNVVNHYEFLEIDNFLLFHTAAMKSLTNHDEPTTRSRSFMFFCHAIAVTQNGSKLIIPENGFISLNIPLYYSRNGSSSTRTTHPYYLSLFRKLLKKVNIDVVIDNPYQFYTKGEMINNCLDPEFLFENIINTMSCSHPLQGRWNKITEPIHCGYCIPCTIRRSSLLELNEEDPTEYRYINYENPIGQETFNALKIALNRYQKASSPYLFIQQSGPLDSDLDKYLEVFNKGNEELRKLLAEVE